MKKQEKAKYYSLLLFLLVCGFLIFSIILQAVRDGKSGYLVDFPIIVLLILLITVSTLVGIVLYPILK